MTLATYSSALGFSPSPNMNIPIAHIPDDVLQEIFLLLAWDIDSPPISKRALKNGFTWLSVSYVCSYWRRLALGSPRLWALINVYEESSLGMVREFLKRSRDLSLCVRFEDHPSFHSERGLDLLQLLITKYRPIESTAMLDKLIAGHSNRIMEFQLVSTRVNTILSSFTSPAPRLRVLDLQSSWPPKPIPTIPFFVNQSPLLHVVRAHKVILPWYPFRNLTEMDIEYDRPPAMDALLQILHDCSSLIVLKLDIQRAILRTSYPQDSSNIELAYLEGLTLSATYDDLAYILSRLSFPATVQIELAFNGDPKVDDVEPCPALLDIASKLDHMCLILHDDDYTAIKSAQTSFQMRWTSHGKKDQGRLGHLGPHLIFHALQHLNISTTAFVMSEHDWVSILGTMPALQSIRISPHTHPFGPHDASLFHALGRVPPSAQADASMGCASILCPGLVALMLTSEFDEGNAWPANEVLQEAVVPAFKTRARLGARLLLLKLTLNSGLRGGFYPDVLTLPDWPEIAEHVMIYTPWRLQISRLRVQVLQPIYDDV
ncbi:hypothetical protein AcW2_005413 [Taiwanofungus camphoratus]|nr:hypothetical protein AcW2_005413 [Antrodia cinnamomea]